jgi:arylformamidase
MQHSGTAVVPETTEVLRDVAYGTDRSQHLDVYMPKSPAKAPIFFLVHGGAWMKGDKANPGVVSNKVAHWVGKGYILVSTNYRLDPPDPLQQADDVAKALAFVQSQATTWGGDPERIVVVGHSSGAHLVSLLASDPSIAAKHGAKPWLGTVALDSAAFDVEKIMNGQHFAFYDRVFRKDPAYWRSASPLHRLTAKVPSPVFVVCSSERRDSCDQARGFVDKVTGLGGRAEMFRVALTHQEITEQLGTSGQYTTAVDTFLQSLGLP